MGNHYQQQAYVAIESISYKEALLDIGLTALLIVGILALATIAKHLLKDHWGIDI